MKKYLFLLPLIFGIIFFFPTDTYAVEIQNPKMEIYGLKDPQTGVAQNYDDLLAGTNGDGCITNPYGVPKYVYVYLPKNTISSYYQYTLKHSFSWRTTLGFDTWPVPPSLQFSNGTAIQYTQNDWKNVYQGTTSEQLVRDNFFVGTFEAPYVNLLTDEVVLVYNFTDYSSNPGKTPFYLEFCSWGINLNTTGVNGDPDNSNLGIVIDNSKNDIIANQNDNFIKEQFANQERFDELMNATPPQLDWVEDSAGWLPPGPVDSLLNLPFTFFTNLFNNLNRTCSPISVPLPFVNQNLILPCISSLYEQIGATEFLEWVGTIVGIFILYNYFLKLYDWVDKTLELEDQNLSEWGGV